MGARTINERRVKSATPTLEGVGLEALRKPFFKDGKRREAVDSFNEGVDLAGVSLGDITEKFESQIPEAKRGMPVKALIKKLVDVLADGCGNLEVKFARQNKDGESWAYNAGSIFIRESPHNLGEHDIVIQLEPEFDGQDNDMPENDM